MDKWSGFLRAYLAIRASGRFDAAHYLGQLRRVGYRRAMPLVHYLWSGERRGREPFPGFSPILYLAGHEELIGTGVSPLHHFLRHGGATLPPPSSTFAARIAEAERRIAEWQPRKRIAIVCHIFYYQLFDEIAATIGESGADTDLIFTVTEKPGFPALAARIAAAWPTATIISFPNHGRDIFPFVALVNLGKLEGYDAVCKIHTKLSPHRRGGDLWRKSLLQPLLADDGRIARIAGRLKDDPSVGLVVADGHILSGEQFFEGTKDRVRTIAARIGIDIDRYPLSFPAGSMYWTGPAVLQGLREVGLTTADFEPETGQVDNTTAHAVERLVGYILAQKGLRAVETSAFVNL